MLEKITSFWSSSPAPAALTPVADAPYDPTNPKVNPLNPKGLKACCACPETKSARDDCFLKFDPSEADGKCKEVVQSHLACMRALGFKM